MNRVPAPRSVSGPACLILLAALLLILAGTGTVATGTRGSTLGDRASVRTFLERNEFQVEQTGRHASVVTGRRPGLEARFRFDGDDVARAEITAQAPILLEEAERQRYIDWLATYAREGEDFRKQVFSDVVARMGSMGGTDVDRQAVLADRVYGIQPRIDIGNKDPSWTLWVERLPSGVSLVSAVVPEQPCPTAGLTASMELVIDYRAEVELDAGMAPTRIWIVVLLPFMPWGDPPELRMADWATAPAVLRPDHDSLVIEGPELVPGETTSLTWRLAYPTDSFIRHEARLVALPGSDSAATGSRSVERVLEATAFGSFGRVAWVNVPCAELPTSPAPSPTG